MKKFTKQKENFEAKKSRKFEPDSTMAAPMAKALKGGRKLHRDQSIRKRLVIPRPNILHFYLNHSDVNLYLEYVQRHFSSFVKLHTIGLSHEERKIVAIDIDWNSPLNELLQSRTLATARGRATSAPAAAALDKVSPLKKRIRNVVFIEGGAHAREWMTISVALQCVHQLTEKNMTNRYLLRRLRFFIVPIVNPDGYEYSRTKNRRWRKNRRPQLHTKNVGTDCNRNYDVHWEEGPTRPLRNTYKGDHAFSEPETCAMRNALNHLQPNLLFLLSLHSYAQSIMYPYGFSRDLPKSWHEMHALAAAGRKAIKAFSGRNYRTGSIANLTKRVISGSIVDYAHCVLRVPLALVMELPSRELGFQPPAQTISGIGEESWHGIREMCKCAYDLAPMLRKYDAQWDEEGTTAPLQDSSSKDITLALGAGGDSMVVSVPKSIAINGEDNQNASP